MGGGLSTHESKWSPVRQRDRYRVGYRRVLSATVTTPDGPREELATRADVDRLLRTFYERALVDPLLAPVFETLAVVGLDEHLPVVGDFWEQILFRTVRYQGHFGPVHEALHRQHDLTDDRFERWLACVVRHRGCVVCRRRRGTSQVEGPRHGGGAAARPELAERGQRTRELAAHSSAIETPTSESRRRTSGRPIPITLEGSPSSRSTNQPPRLSRVNAPATFNGSPDAR